MVARNNPPAIVPMSTMASTPSPSAAVARSTAYGLLALAYARPKR